MSSGVQEGSVRLQRVATEEVRDGAPAHFDCRPTPSPARKAARALRCLSSGYLSDGCPCRSSIPADLVKAAWLQELERGAVPGEGFFRVRARSGPMSVPEKPSLEGLEARWGARWERDGTYRFDRAAPREQVFSIDTPPPTVSGSLHVGHVFSYTHTDIVARYRRMRGQEVFYPIDRKSTRLNSSHLGISYAVFCL